MKRRGRAGHARFPANLVIYCGRHTFGTNYYDKAKNLQLVAKAMGHASITTTAIYVHPDNKGLADVIDQSNAERAALAQEGALAHERHSLRHSPGLIH
jgi:site-specific recombinase XerC